MIRRRNSKNTTSRARSMAICAAFLAINITPGCIELGIITPIGNPTDNGETTNPNDPAPVDNGGLELPVVRLSVTNPAPQINEEVTLTCRITSGDDTNARFDFASTQPPGTGLSIGRSSGRATFIVTESDLGVSFNFSCTATTDAGQSARSSTQTVSPTGL